MQESREEQQTLEYLVCDVMVGTNFGLSLWIV